jgi:hypothetical protein
MSLSQLPASPSGSYASVGRALVGADGLGSAVRPRLLGDGPPANAGYTSWRGIVYRKRLLDPGLASESWGAEARFGIVAMPGGRT